MNDSDAIYLRGNRAAWVAMLHVCLRELHYNDIEALSKRWVAEREEALAILRKVCAKYGDNIWSNDAHLADVIEEHLYVYLEGALRRSKSDSKRWEGGVSVRYRRKRIDVVDAVRVDGTRAQLEAIPWLQDARQQGRVRIFGGGVGEPWELCLPEVTLADGRWVLVHPSEWLIRHDDGQFNTCSHEEFVATYEEAE